MDPNSTAGPVLTAARISYQGDQPYSLDYQDIYHAPDGAAEVERVFMGPCRLDILARERCAAQARGMVRVGELGFGSGFNFVVAAQRCLAAGARLHFISFEAAPIDAREFAAIAARRAAAHPLYAELAEAYPPRIRGWHRRYLAGGRVCLSLWWGTAAAGLADLAGRQRQPLDAWFLDGFAPDRNPDMWQADLFHRLADLSAAGTRIASFTSAGRVRRGLEAAGFAMTRVDQRPHKRESLAGTFQRPGLQRFSCPNSVLVAGSGLAGASAAWHLARAGYRVRLLDPLTSTVFCPPTNLPRVDLLPASHLPATVLHARLLADGSAAAGLRCHGYLYAASLVRHLPGFAPTGALQLAGGTQPEVKLRSLEARYGTSGSWLLWLNAREAAERSAWRVDEGGLYFPDAGVVDTPALVRALTDHPGVDRVAAALAELPDQVPVVLACGAASRDFAPARYLEVAPVHGQLDFVALEALPRLPLVGSGYLVPSRGLLAAGATYEYRPWDPRAASRANLAQLEGRSYTWRFRQRGTRSVSSDRTAIAGALYDSTGAAVENLYVSTGHGSAGNVSAHLAGAVLEALISGEFPPLERRLEAGFSPLRFRQRQARRGYRHGADG